MHIIALVVLAGVLGAIFSWFESRGFIGKVQGALPGSSNMVVKALTVGAFILVALFAADFVVGLFGVRGRSA